MQGVNYWGYSDKLINCNPREGNVNWMNSDYIDRGQFIYRNTMIARKNKKRKLLPQQHSWSPYELKDTHLIIFIMVQNCTNCTLMQFHNPCKFKMMGVAELQECSFRRWTLKWKYLRSFLWNTNIFSLCIFESFLYISQNGLPFRQI